MEVKYPLKVSTVQYKCPKCGNFMTMDSGNISPNNGLYMHYCSSTTCTHTEELKKVYPYIHYDMAIQEESQGGNVSITFLQNK